MAWATPSTRSTTDFITAAIWNADLVDNLKYLKGQAGTVAFEAAATIAGGLTVAGSATFSGYARAQNWSTLSGNSGGQTLLAGNAYTDAADTFKYTNTHASIGAMALSLNYPAWNQAAILSNGSGGSTGDGTFTPTVHMLWDRGGGVYIGDNANANMTVGLTINQGAADNEILAFKSSDVAHGITTLTETDTFADFKKTSATLGGLDINAYTEGVVGLRLVGSVTTGTTTKTTSGLGAIGVHAQLKSGTGVTGMGADANLFYIQAGGSTRFIFDNEGSAHADVEWTTFDNHDDRALLTALEQSFVDPVKAAFGEFVGGNRAHLQKLGIVNFYDNGPRAMVNFTRLSMLLVGAVRQANDRVDRLRAALLKAGTSPALLDGI